MKVMVIKDESEYQNMFRTAGFELVGYNSKKEPDIICFTGGSDVSPHLYGEKTRLMGTYCNPQRDELEEQIFKKYINKPKVGICRGGQFLNVMSGGAMWQDVDGHGRPHEMIDIGLTKKVIKVSSTHHQMMIPSPMGMVLGISHEAKLYKSSVERAKPEFDTEVVWYAGTKSLCYQPHPEYLWGENENRACRDNFFDYVKYTFQ